MAHTADSLKGLSNTDLFGLVAKADDNLRKLLQTEFERRTAPQESAAVSIFVTQSGGIYCCDPNWVAPTTSASAKNKTYNPSVTFATRDMVKAICTSGSSVNAELLRLANLSEPEFIAGMSAHAAKKQAQLIKQRDKLVAGGAATKADLTKFDTEHPEIAKLSAV